MAGNYRRILMGPTRARTFLEMWIWFGDIFFLSNWIENSTKNWSIHSISQFLLSFNGRESLSKIEQVVGWRAELINGCSDLPLKMITRKFRWFDKTSPLMNCTLLVDARRFHCSPIKSFPTHTGRVERWGNKGSRRAGRFSQMEAERITNLPSSCLVCE